MVTVPEANLYEQGHWPSIYNPDHKTTWTCGHDAPWSPVNYSLEEEFEALLGHIIHISTVTTNWDPTLGDIDRTSMDHLECEAAVEGVLQKPYTEEWF